MKTPERRNDVVLVSLSLTLNIFHTLFLLLTLNNCQLGIINYIMNLYPLAGIDLCEQQSRAFERKLNRKHRAQNAGLNIASIFLVV